MNKIDLENAIDRSKADQELGEARIKYAEQIFELSQKLQSENAAVFSYAKAASRVERDPRFRDIKNLPLSTFSKKIEL